MEQKNSSVRDLNEMYISENVRKNSHCVLIRADWLVWIIFTIMSPNSCSSIFFMYSYYRRITFIWLGSAEYSYHRTFVILQSFKIIVIITAIPHVMDLFSQICFSQIWIILRLIMKVSLLQITTTSYHGFVLVQLQCSHITKLWNKTTVFMIKWKSL